MALGARRVGVLYRGRASGTRNCAQQKVLEARRVGVSHMVEASGARDRGATRALKARRVSAKHMVVLSGAEAGMREERNRLDESVQATW